MGEGLEEMAGKEDSSGTGEKEAIEGQRGPEREEEPFVGSPKGSLGLARNT